MSHSTLLRRLMLGVLTGLALAGAGVTLPLTIARPAYAQVAADFQQALAPYGQWIRHPRWGIVWVPDDIPADWRPYRYGHWVYTEEWGWYWISDPEEEDWGWVVFHYGRWAFERALGWFWLPDDEWAPAWVDWRYGGDHVGWAPLPPDELIVAYDDSPDYWIFVSPRFLTAPRLRAYIIPPSRRARAFRHTQIVNRSVGYGRGRAAVNPGLSPAFIARVSRGALPTYRVNPRVLSRTQGVSGAVRVAPDQLRAAPGGGQRGRRPSANRANAVTVQPTNTVVAPAASAPTPQPLGKGERGRLGSHPPRAAQGAPAAAPAAPPAVQGAPPAAQPQTPQPQQQRQIQSPQQPQQVPPPQQQPPQQVQPPPQQQIRPQQPPPTSPPQQVKPPAAAPRQSPSIGGQQPERRFERRDRDQTPPAGVRTQTPPPAQVKPVQPTAPQTPAPAQVKPAQRAAPQTPPPTVRRAPPQGVQHPPPRAGRPQPPVVKPAAPPPPPQAVKPPPPPAKGKPAQQPEPAGKPAPKPEEVPK